MITEIVQVKYTDSVLKRIIISVAPITRGYTENTREPPKEQRTVVCKRTIQKVLKSAPSQNSV